jgi:hypothetical protein
VVIGAQRSQRGQFGGDHLQPNDAGCQAMADAIDLPMIVGRR